MKSVEEELLESYHRATIRGSKFAPDSIVLEGSYGEVLLLNRCTNR